MKKTGEPITQERARRILAKAVELDTGEFTTLQELEIVAREVGISAEAFQAALTHDREASESAHPDRSTVWLTRIVTGAGVPLGIAAGWVLTHLSTFNAGLPMFGIMTAGLAASAGLIALERKSPAAHRFVFRNTIMWAGVAGGSILVIAIAGADSSIDLPWLHSVTASLRNWFMSAVLGAVAVSVMKSNSDVAGTGSAGETMQTGFWTRVGMKVRRIIEVIVERRGSEMSVRVS